MARLLKKVAQVIIRNLIFLLDGVNNRIYTEAYWHYLKSIGVNFTGKPNYISSSAYIDGQGYSLITIGEDVVISREVMLLTHDYSVETALHAIGRGSEDRRYHLNQGIIIGENTFIGARASILPGSVIGKNCIIGAAAVVKGEVPDGCVIIGNPKMELMTTADYANRIQSSSLSGKINE